ncbi:hypothetical protein NE237_016572 [Protea cynaroides]|uniref:Uncharacterized protein n=1 Tax=Protea cynaroides TaxID=273540 RepID=A0A9Q0HEC6_9MAGN|nr:hypothetical protein NE237_016572 [Protea cynaroides]
MWVFSGLDCLRNFYFQVYCVVSTLDSRAYLFPTPPGLVSVLQGEDRLFLDFSAALKNDSSDSATQWLFTLLSCTESDRAQILGFVAKGSPDDKCALPSPIGASQLKGRYSQFSDSLFCTV